MKSKYSKELLEEYASSETSLAGVIRRLNLRDTGGNRNHIRNLLENFEIDTSHFLGQRHNLGNIHKNRRLPQEILVLKENGARTEAKFLRRALIESGVEYQCVSCGIVDTYNDLPIVLEVDHINENWRDNRLENLRFLCPNCHSQITAASVARAMAGRAVKYCIDCQAKVRPTSTRCVSCAAKFRHYPTKVKWPSREEVLDMVKTIGYTGTGRKIGVSDNAVRKFLRR